MSQGAERELPRDTLSTRIWQEVPMADNPYAVARAYCHGYDVFGGLVGQARWVEMLYLLLCGERPTAAQAGLLEALAVGLANPGPRDPSVHAAMCGGIAGSSAAASLMAALAVGAGGEGGARELFMAMQVWIDCGEEPEHWLNWTQHWHSRQSARMAPGGIEVWPEVHHPPGFDPHGKSTATTVCLLLERLALVSATPRLNWLLGQRASLEAMVGLPLNLSGVAAAALVDLGLSPEQGEMLFLLLRLPGAMAHTLEQGSHGFAQFPFGPVALMESGQDIAARVEGESA